MTVELDELAIACGLLMARANLLSKRERAELTGRITHTLQWLSASASEHHHQVRELADIKRRLWNLEHPRQPPEI
jgi:hypothetical protein